ncbi:MAG TPA: xanthine dehydrogenase family protein molybdopterin-binding subunit [Anaerolineae bacterium]|nr:xanthine dehydrogenase family protein molybdopterin-binding subunit [Anaerolineae bacterium]
MLDEKRVRVQTAPPDGRPAHAGDGWSASRIVEVDTGAAEVEETAIVGKPIPRIDGPMKVSGLQQYGADYYVPGMLFVKVVRSPYPHAQVQGIEASDALQLPGVKAVITAADIKGANRHGLAGPNRPALIPIGDNVRYIGDPVAIVVAETVEQAETAAKAVMVDYKQLPAVFDPEDALKHDAPKLNYDRDDNIVSTYNLERGDVEQALAEADAVIEQTYHVPSQDHVQLEPESGIATIDPEGNLTIIAASQDPFYILQMISQALAVPESKIRVKSIASGGSFGVKAHINVQVHLALAALVTKRPVKLVWSREESLLVHPKRHPARIHYKMGARKDGRITVIDVEVLSDSGAYPASSPYVFNVLCGAIPGPYDIPNIRVRGKVVATNNPIKGTFRGYGDPQGFTPTELTLTQMAAKLGIDPVHMRLINGHTPESKPTQHGVHIDHPVMLGETIRQALAVAGPKPEPSRSGLLVGRGMSCVMPTFDVAGGKWGSMAGTAANVEILPEGSAVVRCGVSEIGVGITTVLAQIASEELGVSIQNIQVVFGDSLISPKAGPSVASRQAYTAGNAVREACRLLHKRMKECAARELGVAPEELWTAWGKFVVEKEPSRSLSVPQVAAAMFRTGIDREVHYWFRATHAEYGHLYVTALVDLEVDPETGQIRVLQVVNSHDTGKALNPLNVRGQLIGGGSQALGWVLLEDLKVQNGRLLTPSLTEYLTPTSMDIPDSYKTVIIEAPYPTGPYGAKGVGEHGMDSTPAAILNAIYDAIGVMMTQWPVTSEALWKALRQ